MKLYKVYDLEFQQVLKDSYHIAIFSSGFEERCTFISQKLDKRNIKIPIILGFEELSYDVQRQKNDLYFKQNWDENISQQTADNDIKIYSVLEKYVTKNYDEIKFLVDYSSMSRVWYAAILNWIKFTRPSSKVTIDFLYSIGKHHNTSIKSVIKDMLCIPGLDGIPIPLNKSIAIFGLGFDGGSPLCVLDRLEPDEIFTYLASPGAFPDYSDIAEMNNKILIEESKRPPLKLPLRSVERTYSSLSEVVSPFMDKADIAIFPMGPKPHILAAILISMKFDRFISCMHVSHILKEPSEITSTGEVVATRIEFLDF